MLLTPSEYDYSYFHQPRGKEGGSGPIYKGTPLKAELCPVLVKSVNVATAINEFIGCGIGKRLGVNVPRAWLFRTDTDYYHDGIDFACAVGVEFLPGLEEKTGDLFANDEIAAQTIRANLLHRLVTDRDNFNYGLYNGKVYTFDFAISFYPEHYTVNVVKAIKQAIDPDTGFDFYRRDTVGHEDDARRDMHKLVFGLQNENISDDLVAKVYSDMRDRMMAEYNKDQFSDLVADVEAAYSSHEAQVVRDRLFAMQQAMVSL